MLFTKDTSDGSENELRCTSSATFIHLFLKWGGALNRDHHVHHLFAVW